MTAQADRTVLFKLAVEADAGARQRFREFVKLAEEADRTRVNSATKAAENVRAAREKGDSVYLQGYTRQRAAQEAAEERSLERGQRAWQRYSDQRTRIINREIDARIKAAGRAEQAEIRGQERAVALAERANQQMTRANQAGARAMLSMVSGATTLVGGLAKIGLVGEESLTKIVSGLVAIQAGMDVVRGGLAIWRAMTRAVQLYEASLHAAAAAELLLGGAGVVGGGATMARGGGLVRGAAGVGRDVGLVVAGGAMGRPGFAGWLGRAGRGVAGFAGRATPYLGAALGGFGIGEGIRYLTGHPTHIGAWRESATAEAEAATSTRRLQASEAYEASQADVREEARLRLRAEYDVARQSREEQEAAWEARLEGHLEGAGYTGAALNAAMARDRLMRAAPAAWAARGRLAGAEGEFQAKRQTLPGLAELRGWKGAELQERMVQERDVLIEALEKERTAWTERLRAEREITQERIRGADTAVELAKKEIDVRRKGIEEQQRALLTAEERFGQLAPAEQRQAVALMFRAQRGEALELEELQQLERIGTLEATGTARAGYRRFAQRALRGMGLGEQAFAGLFGRGELAKIGELQQQEGAWQLELTGQQEFKVTLEQDVEAMAQRVGQVIARLTEERGEQIARRAAEIAARELDERERQRWLGIQSGMR